MSDTRGLSDLDFTLFQALVERETGISLPAVKKPFLTGRLDPRLRELGLPSHRAYLDLCQRDPAERTHLLERIATHETSFFREPKQFELLEHDVFPRWRREAEAGSRPRRARVWSAACASGEEPWSLAMALLQAFPSRWDLAILATDLSARVLERARTARYEPGRAPQIPAHLRTAHWEVDAGGYLSAGPALRALVHFERVNLIRGGWPVGPFDLVFCRNVLIYFEPRTRAGVVFRLLEKFTPDGYLFLGGAETLGGTAAKVRTVIPTVYAPLPAAG